jgi:hypothetical protein
MLVTVVAVMAVMLALVAGPSFSRVISDKACTQGSPEGRSAVGVTTNGEFQQCEVTPGKVQDKGKEKACPTPGECEPV